MHWNWRKIGIVFLVALLAVGGIAYGAYQYLLHRYAQQIDDLLSDLIDESATDADSEPELPIASTQPPETSTQPPAQSGSANPSTTPDQQVDAPAQTDAEDETTQTSEPPDNEQTEPDATATTEPMGEAIVDATAGLSLTDSEMDLVGDLPSLLGQMTSDEKVMLVKTLMKFSPNEILNLYRLYQSGDAETKAQVKEQVKAKFTDEDIDLIKQMAAKYR